MTTPSYDSAGSGRYTGPSAMPPMPMEPIPLRNSGSRNGWIIGGVIGGLVLLLCCGAPIAAMVAAGFALEKSFDDSADPLPVYVEMNEAGRDGALEFTVREVECGERSAFDPAFDPTRQLCRVTVQITNVSGQPTTFDVSHQLASDTRDDWIYPEGTEEEHAEYLSQERSLGGDAPFNEITEVLVFDLPTDRELASVELHSDYSSNGVIVRLP